MPNTKNNNGYSYNDVSSLLEKETAAKIRAHQQYLKQKLSGMEDEALKQKEINRQMDIYKAKEYEALNIKKQQIQEQMRQNQYESASLNGKLRIVEADAKSLNLKIQEAQAYADISRGTSEEANAQQLLNNLVDRRNQLLDQQNKLQNAINYGANANAGIIQKLAYAEQRRAQYRADLAAAENKYKEALMTADNPFEKEKAKYQYNKDKYNVEQRYTLWERLFSGVDTVAAKLDTLHDDMQSVVKDTMNTMSRTMYKIDTRLYGANGTSFVDIVGKIQNQMDANPYISNKQYLDNIVALTESGIAYNLEQRAYLATVSDRMVSTFNVLDDTLTRLIRLQQSDMTYSQLGAESQLTKLLNGVFSDTSYLNNVYDTVASALIDSAATLNRDNATAYEYAVQKWLGALYSVGMSDSAVSMIAQGLNMLGTGNVSALNGNNSLQTLLAMSASRAGISYADILNTGLDATTVNELMKSMVEYLGDIAENTSNKVTRAAFGDIYNLTQSDLRAIQNLTTGDMASIYNSTISYNTAMKEYQNQLGNISNRTMPSQRVDNVIDNIMFDFGTSVLIPDDYSGNIRDIIWRYIGYNAQSIAETLEPVVGSTVSNIAKALGKVGEEYITLEATSNSIAHLFSSFFNNRDTWNTGFAWDEYTSRGGNYTDAFGNVVSGTTTLAALLNNFAKGVSYSSNIASIGTSAEEKYNLSTSFAGNLKTASTATVVGYDEVGIERTVSDIYAQLFDNQRVIRVSIASLEEMAKENLSGALEKEEFKEMTKKIQDTLVNDKIKVDVVDDDVSAITSAIGQVRRY